MKFLSCVVALCILTAAGCKSESKCEKTAAKLQGCGLLETTKSVCEEAIPADEAKETSCWFGCALQASCQQLVESLCEGEDNALTTCSISCFEASGFSCGDGVSVSTSSKCDGFDDCDNGADEVGCKTIACQTGGQRVVEAVKCDGFDDCDDGSDELGCPTFKCKSGEAIPLQYKCDEEEDCSDASDELGCSSDEAELICKGS